MQVPVFSTHQVFTNVVFAYISAPGCERDSARIDAFLRWIRAKIPKTRGIGMQIQHPFAQAKYGSTILLITVSVKFGISCIRAEIPPTNGIKRPERPDSNTNKVVAIRPTMLFFMVNLLF
jgi:hypothetical protein